MGDQPFRRPQVGRAPVKASTRRPWGGFILVTALAIHAGDVRAAQATSKDEPAAPITLPLEGKLTPPRLKTAPSQEDIWRDYPKLANFMGMSGRAQVTCDVEADATVDHCVANTEVPTGLGFGAAATHVASGFHMIPATLDGAPVKAKYTASIRFMAPDRPIPTPTAMADAPPPSEARLVLARRLIDRGWFKDWVTRSYETAAQQANQELEWSGRPAETQAAMDAFRQGVQDVLAVILERKAREAAARMNEAELTASLAFLDSSAGQAWLAFTESADPDQAADFQSRVMLAARARYCAKVQCDPAPGEKPATPTPPS
jgi:hypothetical protein